jgi:O-antigen/teichoic acid export membrane protein
MLGYLTAMDRVAVYDIGFSLAIFAFFPFLALVKTSELKSDDFSKGSESTTDYYRNLDIALKLGFLISLGGILFGRYFLPIFGGGYMESYDVLAILLLGFFTYGFFGTPVEILAWNNNRKTVSALIVVCLSINISLNAYFIPLYEGVGAASVSVFSMVLLRLISAGLVWNRYEIISVAKVKPFLLGLTVLMVNVYFGHYFSLLESILVFLMVSLPIILPEYHRLRLMFR